MKTNVRSDIPPVNTLLDEKLQLEIQKLKLEKGEIERKWFKKPQWWAALLPGVAVLIVGICTLVIALWTGYINAQRASIENTNTLLEIKKNTLQRQIDSFTVTKETLVLENKHLKENANYLLSRIHDADDTKTMYDSAIKMQKGTIGQRNRYTAGLLQQISSLRGENQQLKESITKQNTNVFALGSSVPLGSSNTLLSINGLPGTNSLPGTLNSQAFFIDTNGHLAPTNQINLNSFSRPLYIQDTSSSIFKLLHKSN